METIIDYMKRNMELSAEAAGKAVYVALIQQLIVACLHECTRWTLETARLQQLKITSPTAHETNGASVPTGNASR